MAEPAVNREADPSCIRPKIIQVLEDLLAEAEGDRLDDEALKCHVFETVVNFVYSITSAGGEWNSNRAIIQMVESIEKSMEAEKAGDPLVVELSEQGLSWNSPGLDLLMGNLMPGERVLLCGKSGSGKSALLLSLMCEQMRNGKNTEWPLGWINLNMPEGEFSRRMASVLFDVAIEDKKSITVSKLNCMAQMAESLCDTPVQFMHDPELSATQILEVGARWAQRDGIKVLVIDGYPLPHFLDDKWNEKLALFHTVTYLLARDHQLRIIVTCQLPAGFEEWNAPSLRQFLGSSKLLPERLLLMRADTMSRILLEGIDNLHDSDKAVPLLQNPHTLALREP